jgi:peptide/nickel transport system permease protein
MGLHMSASSEIEARPRSWWTTALRHFWANKKALVGSVMLLSVLVAAVFASVIVPYDPTKLGVGPLLAQPDSTYLLGTDNFGRDTFSRLVFGARISLLSAFGVIACSATIGMVVGLLTGYLGGTLDYLVMRVVDVLFAFPWVLIALAIAAILGPGIRTVLISLVIVYSPILVRLTRAVTLSIREQEYIQAARVIGQRDSVILFRHVLPNTLSPLIVQSTSIMGFCILAEAAISYLGLGTRPPTPSWGLSLSDGAAYLWVAPGLVVFPGLAIAYLVMSFNFLGDGLRDILDPRYQG